MIQPFPAPLLMPGLPDLPGLPELPGPAADAPRKRRKPAESVEEFAARIVAGEKPEDIESALPINGDMAEAIRNRVAELKSGATPPAAPAPAAEPGVLASIGSSALSGLGAAGNLLDLVPSMLRDVVTLDNPLDQLLSPLSSENRNTGRDVLTKWGVTDKNDPDQWELADFLGFGVDLASGLPLGGLNTGARALTPAGALAKNAGMLDDIAKVAPAGMGPRVARATTTLRDVIAPRADDEFVDELANLTKQSVDAPASATGMGAEHLSRIPRFDRALDPVSVSSPQRYMDLLDTADKMGLDGLEPLLDQPLGGLASWKLPFTSMEPAVFGTGERGLKVAGWLDDAGRAIHDARIPGTDFAPIAQARALLDSNIGEATTPMGRRLMQSVTAGRREGEELARGQIADVRDLLAREGGEFAGNSPDVEQALRRAFEGVAFPQNMGVEKADDMLRAVFDPMPARAAEWGVKLPELIDSVSKYFPRQLTKSLKRGKADRRVVTTADAFAGGREPILKDLGQGTDTIYQLLDHPGITQLLNSGGKTDDIAVAIRRHFADQVPETYLNAAGNAADRPKAIAKWLQSLDPEVRASGVFGNHPLQDALARATSFEQAMETAQRTLANLADDGVLAEAAKRSRTKGTTKLGDVLRGIGMDTAYTVDEAGNVVGGGALRKWLQLKGQAVTEDAIKAANDLQLPKDFADDVLRVDKVFKGPDAVGPIVKQIDNFTSLFKVGVLTTPAFHVRNLGSGQTQNLLAGTWSKRSTGAMHKILTGKGADVAKIPIIREELRRAGLPATPENAADVARNLMFRFKMVPKFEQKTMPTVGAAAGESLGSTMNDLISANPGGVVADAGRAFQPLTGAKEAFKGGRGTAGTTWNPFKAEYRGIGEGVDNTLAPVAASDIAGHYVEGMNRGAPFLELLWQGVHPKEARRRVLAAQVDYSRGANTRFVNDVGTRVFPFAKFTAGAMPYTIRTLAEQPGGRMAQVVRATAGLGGADASTPDHVAGTTSIPLGTADDGTRRFLTGLGLMHEGPLSYFGDDSLLRMLSQTNPLIQAPLQHATNESFFQIGPDGGRDLDSLDPAIGRTMANVVGSDEPITFPGSDALEFVFANSPFSRIVSNLRTATDRRKGIVSKVANLATGVRVTDVSPAAQDAVLRERAQALMKQLGARGFETFNIPEAKLEQMAPADRAMYAELKGLISELTKKGKQRKAAREMAKS